MIPSRLVASFFTFCLVTNTVVGQSFNSGSTGIDGALVYVTPGTYVFDPKTFATPLDQDGDGIFNFTTINIATGVTLRLSGDVYAAPIVWLAQGTVVINGTIDASGQNGFNATNTTQRTITIPGAGGYGGGYPAIGSNPSGDGLGPAAGKRSEVACPNGGFVGNQFLVPLMGGSGGGGGGNNAGAAGGGAVLIASSVSISGAGSISVRGGNSINNSGGGSGGAIRLVAPMINLTGSLNAGQGNRNVACNPSVGSSDGVVRIEAGQIGSINATGSLYTATPYALFLSSGFPSLRVSKVGDNDVNPSPTGTFTVPDVSVNSNGNMDFLIEGKNVPLGTIVTLVLFSENGPDKSVQSTPLTGSLASSTATATTTLPAGFSRGFVKALVTQ